MRITDHWAAQYPIANESRALILDARIFCIMLTNDKMAVAATLEISFTESFNLVLKYSKSRKIAFDVVYDSSKDTKETRGVDRYFC